MPLNYGRALFDAAPEPNQLQVFRGLGHDLAVAATEYRRAMADWIAHLVQLDRRAAGG